VQDDEENETNMESHKIDTQTHKHEEDKNIDNFPPDKTFETKPKTASEEKAPKTPEDIRHKSPHPMMFEENDTNSISDYESESFPKKYPGENNIAKSNSNLDSDNELKPVDFVKQRETPKTKTKTDTADTSSLDQKIHEV